MLALKKFDANDFNRYPYVETLGGDIVPRLARVKMATREDLLTTVVVDGNGIRIVAYDEAGIQRMIFCRELYPFPLAVFVAEHLDEPLDPDVLIRFGFERFK